MSDPGASFRVGAWTVVPELNRIACPAGTISLRPQVMELLTFLAEHRGMVISTEQLQNRLWANKVVTEGAVYNTIAELRNALASADDSLTYIQTIPKKGYRLVAPVLDSRISPQDGTGGHDTTTASRVRNRPTTRLVVSVTAVVVILVLAALAPSLFTKLKVDNVANRNAEPIRRFTVELPEKALNRSSVHSPVIISRDGQRLLFNGEADFPSPVYSRSIDDLQVEAISGTEFSGGAMALSPDGDWVAFVDLKDGLLKKVPTSGGTPVTVGGPDGKLWSMTWGTNGIIVYESSAYAGLMQVPSKGGVPTRLTTPKPGVFHKHPSFSADGKALFFSVGDRGSTTRTNDRIAVLSFETGEEVDLLAGVSPKPLGDDYLLYYRDHTVWATKFDADELRVTGNSVPVAVDVHYENFAHFSLSEAGTLVYVLDTSLKRRSLVWIEEDGSETPLPIESRPFFMPRISPDGKSIAVVVNDYGGADLWLYSIERGTLDRLTKDESREASPVWSRDSSFIVYSSDRVDNLYRVSTDGTGLIEQLTESDSYQFAYSIFPSNRMILFSEGVSNSLSSHLSVLALDTTEPPKVLLKSEFNLSDPAISPDGHWLAYVSNRSGIVEVYVRPYPNVHEKAFQVSIGGGMHPIWSEKGRKLFYRGQSDLMVATIETEPDFNVNRTEPVLSLDNYFQYDLRNFDIAPDGQRFLMAKPLPPSDFPENRVVVVQNWLNDALYKFSSE